MHRNASNSIFKLNPSEHLHLSFLCPILSSTSSPNFHSRRIKNKRFNSSSSAAAASPSISNQPIAASSTSSSTSSNQSTRISASSFTGTQFKPRFHNSASTRTQPGYNVKGKQKAIEQQEVEINPQVHSSHPSISTPSSSAINQTHFIPSSSSINEDQSFPIASISDQQQSHATRGEIRTIQSSTSSSSSPILDQNWNQGFRSSSISNDQGNQNETLDHRGSSDRIKHWESSLPSNLRSILSSDRKKYQDQLSESQINLLTIVEYQESLDSIEKNQRKKRRDLEEIQKLHPTQLPRFILQSLQNGSVSIPVSESHSHNRERSIDLQIESSFESWIKLLKRSYHFKDRKSLEALSFKSMEWMRQRKRSNEIRIGNRKKEFLYSQKEKELRDLIRNLFLSLDSKDGLSERIKEESLRIELQDDLARNSLQEQLPSSSKDNQFDNIAHHRISTSNSNPDDELISSSFSSLNRDQLGFTTNEAFEWNSLLGFRNRNWSKTFNVGKKIREEEASNPSLSLNSREAARKKWETETRLNSLPPTSKYPRLNHSKEKLNLELRNARGEDQDQDLILGFDLDSNKRRSKGKEREKELQREKDNFLWDRKSDDPQFEFRQREWRDLQVSKKRFEGFLKKKQLDQDSDLVFDYPPTWLLLQTLKGFIRKGEVKKAQELVFTYLKSLETFFDREKKFADSNSDSPSTSTPTFLRDGNSASLDYLPNLKENYPVTKPFTPPSGDILLNSILRTVIWNDFAAKTPPQSKTKKPSDEWEDIDVEVDVHQNQDQGSTFEKCLNVMQRFCGIEGEQLKSEMIKKEDLWSHEGDVRSRIKLIPSENTLLLLLSSLSKRRARVQIGIELVRKVDEIWSNERTNSKSSSDQASSSSHSDFSQTPTQSQVKSANPSSISSASIPSTVLGNGKAFRVLLAWSLRHQTNEKQIQQILTLWKDWRRGKESEAHSSEAATSIGPLPNEEQIPSGHDWKNQFNQMSELRGDDFKYELQGLKTKKEKGEERRKWIMVEQKLIKREIEKSKKEKRKKGIERNLERWKRLKEEKAERERGVEAVGKHAEKNEET